VPWVETDSASFAARHESTQADEAIRVLDQLEAFRERMAGLFGRTPGEVSVVIHAHAFLLGLAHPWLAIARFVTAPASRRYLAGWFGSGEIHVLAQPVLERRASNVPGSREALLLTPHHEYAHLVVGANNPDLPPPFTPSSFRHYLRWAWLSEGAATHFSGQVPHLRAAIARRLHEGDRPRFPPSAADAQLLGGTVFALLEQQAGPEAAVALARSRHSHGPRPVIQEAFGRPVAEVTRAWRDYLESLTAA
jgi:hypothetical protein